MKNIRIFLPDAYLDIWLEVRKFFSSVGFENLKDGCPRNPLRVSESTPDNDEKFYSILIAFSYSYNLLSYHDFRSLEQPLKLQEIILSVK